MMINPLLPELITLQQRDRYLRHEALVELSQRLQIPINRIYSVASFYRMFRFIPCGKHHIKVCVGAACYVKGAETLFDAFAKHLNIRDDSDTSPDGLFTLSKVSCLGCCMLAVAVQIDRHIFGHVTPNVVPHVLSDFLRLAKEEDDSATTRPSLEKFRSEIRVCRCSSCRAAGSARVYKSFEAERIVGGFDFSVKEVGCHGMSYRAPLVMVVADDIVYHYDGVREHEVKAVLSNHFTPTKHLRGAVWKGKAFLETFYRRKNRDHSEKTTLSQASDMVRLITRNSGITHPESLDEYREHGGFVAFEKAATMSKEAIIELLEQSKLRGRGGGGFPTGEKWRLALNASGNSKVVICNADEGDPGAFMDRMLLESYPYRILEGMLIASMVLDAKAAIIYIRDEYAQAITVLEKVIARLRDAGYFKRLGDDFDMIVFRGAGAFVCGEETALLESIEGKRGIPRKRPPFPVTSGLNGMPTLINNVETFACVPMILADDGKAFCAEGTEQSRGTKAFALAGKVRQGGLIEVPIGISIADIVEKFGGGAESGHGIKAVMIGGPSGGCISRKHFGVPVDYETLQKNGAMMGSGGLVVLDERDCMVDLSLYFLRFLREESCGKCVMCREGIARLCDLIEQMTRHNDKDGSHLENIEALARRIQQGSLCALGRTAPNMVLSALHEFRHEFEAHLQNACPAGKCTELTDFQISNECIGCTKCAQYCAANAIECEVLERSQVVSAKCVKCGVCRTVCPQHAISNVHRAVLKNSESSLPIFVPTMIDADFVQVDGELYPFVAGKTLLDDAAERQWEIPTLCHLKDVNENAHCMVCAVWDASLGRFVPGCEQLVQQGHVYETKSEQVNEFRKEALSLMLRRHDFRCVSCSAKGKCQFLDLILQYSVKKEKTLAAFPEKIHARYLAYDGGKCILCQRCSGLSQHVISVHNRSEHSCISPHPNMWDDISRDNAKKVCAVCPTGALSLQGDEQP